MSHLRIPPGFADPVKLQKRLHQEPEERWIHRGESRVLRLFHGMAERVPAYKDFLKKNKVDYKKIKTIGDFKNVPPIDKDNYLRIYKREDLCWDGQFDESSWVISTTSGSTGKPYYFPRQDLQDRFYAVTAELYLRENFQIQDKSTLYIVAFPMGAWIGGVFTYEALKQVAERGKYNLSVITPGIHKKEILESVLQLGKDFDQVIIGSYAPFLKDILDDGEAMGVDWSDYNLGFVFSAEAFSETFRDYVVRKTGLKDSYTTTLNHYGTVDLGTMSHETPISIMLRRYGLENPDYYNLLVSDTTRQPTFTQYIPELFYFEEVNKGLYCSSFSGLPLVRYDLKDQGGVVTFNGLKDRSNEFGVDITELAKQAKIDNTIWQLPFVYVYERQDLSVSYYAFLIYPETIRRALHDKELENQVTGKFTMQVFYDDDGQQVLELNIELKHTKEETERLHGLVMEKVTTRLLDESSEFRETHKLYGEKIFPRLVFWPYEDQTYFRPGTKQKWVKKG